MRKLSPVEHQALLTLSKYPAYVPGDADSVVAQAFVAALRSLVKKGYATVTMTDDGPAFATSAQGREAVRQ